MYGQRRDVSSETPDVTTKCKCYDLANLLVDFRNFIVFLWAETLAHWNPTSCQKNIHNQFVRIRDSQIENSKIEIMETDGKSYVIIIVSISITISIVM